ncbi:hypothetical protein D3876_07935 [Sphingomonas cavernae]|uniref:Uncharacterized protein n=1 Tax=Sphingomonas cavernae TaxID=2320861 RepID=A0A418WJI1_9SPHN|nr:hypothetical protein D3876_07935 [Sphingomonas cavernae]
MVPQCFGSLRPPAYGRGPKPFLALDAMLKDTQKKRSAEALLQYQATNAAPPSGRNRYATALNSATDHVQQTHGRTALQC